MISKNRGWGLGQVLSGGAAGRHSLQKSLKSTKRNSSICTNTLTLYQLLKLYKNTSHNSTNHLARNTDTYQPKFSLLSGCMFFNLPPAQTLHACINNSMQLLQRPWKFSIIQYFRWLSHHINWPKIEIDVSLSISTTMLSIFFYRTPYLYPLHLCLQPYGPTLHTSWFQQQEEEPTNLQQ